MKLWKPKGVPFVEIVLPVGHGGTRSVNNNHGSNVAMATRDEHVHGRHNTFQTHNRHYPLGIEPKTLAQNTSALGSTHNAALRYYVQIVLFINVVEAERSRRQKVVSANEKPVVISTKHAKYGGRGQPIRKQMSRPPFMTSH